MGYFDDYLEHHGILGQKWGVRRYQNKDGTLTPAGQKRYAYEIKTKDAVIDKLSKFKKYAEEDTQKSLKRYNETQVIDDAAINKKLYEDFGYDAKNKDYVNRLARDYGYKDAREYAVEELKYEHQQQLVNSNKAKEYAKRCDELVKHYQNVKVQDLSREDVKILRKLSDTYYSFVWDLDNKYHIVNQAHSKYQGG